MYGSTQVDDYRGDGELSPANPASIREVIMAQEDDLPDYDHTATQRSRHSRQVRRQATALRSGVDKTNQDPSSSRIGKTRLKTALIVGLLLVPCGFIIYWGLLFLNGCGDILPYRQSVDIQPLIGLEISPSMDLSHWAIISRGKGGLDTISPDYRATIRKYDSIEAARYEFDRDHLGVGPCPNQSTYGGKGANRYCFSPIQTGRYSPDALCKADGTYHISALIQKEDVLIEIAVDSSQRNTTDMDAAIASLAQELRQAMDPSFAPCNIEATPGHYYAHGGRTHPTDTTYCLKVSPGADQITLSLWISMAAGIVSWTLTDPQGTPRWDHEVAGMSFEYPTTSSSTGSHEQFQAIPGIWHLQVVTADMAGEYTLIWTETP